MNLQPSTAVPSIGETFGALYVGTTIAAVLFGITNLQTVIYYKRYPNDWWLYRYSVALLWVLDTLHVVLSTHALYFYLIEMFGDLSSALVHNIWSFKVQLVINVVIVVYVPGLYAIRLWKLGRHFHKILPWFVFLDMASSLGAGIFIIYEIHIRHQDINLRHFLHSSGDRLLNSPHDVLLSAQEQSSDEYIYHGLSCAQSNATRYCVRVGYEYMLAIDSYIVHRMAGIPDFSWDIYVNSLLAMFNHRPKHQSYKPNVDREGHSASAILQFAPHTTAETDVSIPPSEIQEIGSFDDKFNHSQGNPCLEG
ncbi:hypothetical protein ARMSODRAFT_1027692 [Armillaria solidipes]|uniref:Uncharacterized protein n=1 Tax=Armillaria solidipes TaxID=1076256 RepID=A0A2H3AZD7_9AGAR|nr:hypothetical protein ARMSODRAFT_1027692 [Armillaria solidipes]